MSVWFGSEKSEPFHAFIPIQPREEVQEMSRTLVKQCRLMNDNEWHGRSVRTVDMPLDRLVAKEVYKLTRKRTRFERVDGKGWTTLQYKDEMGNVVRREFSVIE